MNTVFVNPERCIGCKHCQIACAVAHSESKTLFGAVSESPTPRPRILVSPGLYLGTSFPNKCRHCSPAPCLSVCPTGAIGRDTDRDTVLVDGERCISCAMCAMVCPFDVITFYPALPGQPNRQVAVKCDHCIDRQEQGQIPACVEACKTNALEFGDINELIKKSRTQLAVHVSAGAGDIQSEQVELPENIAALRALGESICKAGKEI